MVDPDRETMVPCPKCDGDGMLRTEDATTVRAVSCGVCAGAGVVSVMKMREWKIANATRSRS